MSITSPKRLGALALMAVFAVAACSSATGGSTGEPTASDIAPSANAPAPSGDPVAGGIIAAAWPVQGFFAAAAAPLLVCATAVILMGRRRG